MITFQGFDIGKSAPKDTNSGYPKGREANLIVLGARTFKSVMGGKPAVMWHQRGSCINRPTQD